MPLKRGDKIEFYQDEAGEYRWRKVAANGEPIAVSGEGYTRPEDAERASLRANDTSEGEWVLPRDPE